MPRTRRYLSLLGGTLITSALLSGCFGMPPSRKALENAQTFSLNQAAKSQLETSQISLGFLPILEAAPLVIGVHKGFFAKHGLEVTLSKQASWTAARDNVVLGSGGGGIDGGQWQMPMPQMISEGAITNGKKVPMVVLAMLMSQGNGIAAADSVKQANLSANLKPEAGFFKQFQEKEGRKFRAAYTFPRANQDMWLRWWLAAGGVNPNTEVELLTVPTPETLQAMRNQTMEAFSTGDPWPSRIRQSGIGYLAASTAQLWKVHPEEYLAIRSDWVNKNPKATIALLKGLMEAQMWLDQPQNKAEAAQILGSRKWYNVPVPILERALRGQLQLGAEGKTITDPKLGPLYWSSDRGVISYPYKSLTMWFLVESLRWKFYPGTLDNLEEATAINNRAVRDDLWLQAAKELGIPAKDIPRSTSRGKEVFFDGTVYDPSNPKVYLNSLKIKG